VTAAGTRGHSAWERRVEAPASRADEADRLVHIDQLLAQMQEAIRLMRSLLRDLADDETGGAFGMPGMTEPFPASLSHQDGAVDPNFPAEARFVGGRGEAMNRELLTRRLIRDRFASIGHVGAGVLIRLLCTPGEFVSCDDLARSAGVRSASNRVVKVYICRLRSALGKFGLPSETIETGRRSYRLQNAAVPRIMASLAERPTFTGE